MAQIEANEGVEDHEQGDQKSQVLRPGAFQGFQDARNVVDLLLDGDLTVDDDLGLEVGAEGLNQPLVVELQRLRAGLVVLQDPRQANISIVVGIERVLAEESPRDRVEQDGCCLF